MKRFQIYRTRMLEFNADAHEQSKYKSGESDDRVRTNVVFTDAGSRSVFLPLGEPIPVPTTLADVPERLKPYIGEPATAGDERPDEPVFVSPRSLAAEA